MPDLRIRRYESRDADAVWRLHVRALSDAGAYDEEFAHLDADLREIESEYLDAGGEFLVGELGAYSVDEDIHESGDAPAGASGLAAMGGFQPYDPEVHVQIPLDLHPETADRTAVLRRMRVDPDHQRRGFASALLAELEDRSRTRGFGRLVLDTTSRQTAAVAFYEARGYERWHREECSVEGSTFELLCYGKTLAEG